MLDHVGSCAACATRAAGIARAHAEDSESIGRYVVLGELGRGQFGRVLQAYDPELDRTVAIKLLAALDPASVATLVSEAQAMAQVEHPSIVPVYDAGQSHAGPFVAMRAISGPTLDQWVRRDAPAAAAILDIARQICGALVAVHAAGIVHRDIKPANILVGDDRAYVTDFGLARGAAHDPSADRDWRALDSLPATRHDVLISTRVGAGTPAYMAPELLAGATATPKSDQFALAVTLWEILCGKRPFGGDTLAALRARQLQPLDHRALVAAGVSTRAARAICRALAPDPAHRFDDLRGFSAALAPRATTGVWLALGGCALAAAALLALRPAPPSAMPALICKAEVDSAAAVWSDERAASLRHHLALDPAVALQAPVVLEHFSSVSDDLRALGSAACRERETSTSRLQRDCLRQLGARVDAYLDDVLAMDGSELSTSLLAQAASLSTHECRGGQLAQRFADVADDDHRRWRLALHAELARAGDRSRREPPSDAHFARALALAGAAPAPERAHAVSLVQAVRARGAREHQAQEQAARAVLATGTSDRYARAFAWVMVQEALQEQGEWRAQAVADVAAEEALGTAGQPPDLAALSYMIRANRHAVRGDADAYLRDMEQARQAYVAMGDEASVAVADSDLASFFLAQADPQKARKKLDLAEPGLRRWFGPRSDVYLEHLWLEQIWHSNQHDTAAALEIAERVIATTRALYPTQLADYLPEYVQLLSLAGRHEEAVAAAEEAVAAGLPPEHPLQIRNERALATALIGDRQFDRAVAILRRHAPIVREDPQPVTVWSLIQLGRALDYVRDAEGAAQAYAWAWQACNQLGHQLSLMTAGLLHGEALVVAGRDDEAREILERVIDSPAPSPMTQYRGRAAYALLLARAGELADARRQVAAARRIERHCQKAPACQAAAARLARLGTVLPN